MTQKACLIALVLVSSSLQCAPTVTFFLRPYPTPRTSYDQDSQKLARPGKIAKHTVKAILHTGVSGIFATYAGALAVSDMNGQIRFELKQTKPQFYIAVTNLVTPVLLAHNTIHHWEYEIGTPVGMYSVEKKYDEDSRAYYWLTTKATPPSTNIIDLETIILFAKPTNVYIPEGITISDNNTNLTLPDIYIKKGIDKASNALYVLNFKNFFSPITLEIKTSPNSYTSSVKD